MDSIEELEASRARARQFPVASAGLLGSEDLTSSGEESTLVLLETLEEGVVKVEDGENLFVIGVKGLELRLLGVNGEVTERSCLAERFKR